MKSFKPFLYIIYTLMFLITVLLMFNNTELVEWIGQDHAYRFWMIWAMIGFVLLMLESVFENIHISSVRRKQEKLNRENIELKAKLYDKHVAGETSTLLPSRPYTDDKDRL